jgi:hypothetical protein
MNRTSPEQRAAEIREKLAQGVVLPPPERLMNTGERRTPEKREMLRRLKELAEERGQKPWPAKF